MFPLLAVVVAAAPLTFEDALSQAAQAPQVAAAERASRVRSESAPKVSSLQANPTVGLQPGVRNNAQDIGPEVLGSISQPFNLAGAGAARKDAVALEVAHEQGGARLEAHLSRLSVAEAWLAVWSAQGVLAEAQRELELARELGVKVERAAKSGAFTRVDAAAVRAWVAEAQLAVLSAEGQVFDTGIELNRALGLDASAPTQVSATLPGFPEVSVAALDESVSRAEQAPAVRSARLLADAEEARAKELLASKGTWLQVGAMGGREGLGDVVALATLSLTLPVFDNGQREAAPLRAAAAHAEGQRVLALAEARAQRVLVKHELEHTKETLEVVEQALVPANDEAANGTQKRLEAGEATSQEWVFARRAALSARSRLVQARAAYTLAQFRAQELIGVTR